MIESTPRMELIQNYKRIEADLIEAASFGRPVCSVLAGDLMVLTGRLSVMEKTRDSDSATQIPDCIESKIRGLNDECIKKKWKKENSF